MRLPSSVSELVSSLWFAGLTSFQPRMISGAWLDAYTPTSLAMARPRRGGGPGGSHFSQGIPLGHSPDPEIEPKQGKVEPPRGESQLRPPQPRAHLRPPPI